MERHTIAGDEILSSVNFPWDIRPIVRSHHERWDGKGYPQGLKGEEIPLGARILSVVDYFDALTSDRPYHRAMTQEAALGLQPDNAYAGYNLGKALYLRGDLDRAEALLRTPDPETADRLIREGDWPKPRLGGPLLPFRGELGSGHQAGSR